ncbi:hypothetical protein [Variovorax paradoxus]|uniref:hypothetical protein n=1 Tax=Variovorax paradoxus TaxID=34073 RepID=UPI0028558130|nr:hypothetical protein [Variovorax paradoxus]MDR6453920.1 hypothetical protein [Variovorax paradoxus]
MRNTQKKGSRTPALIRARRRHAVRAAVSMAITVETAKFVTAMWANSIAAITGSFDARGPTAAAIARAAGYREPPERESAIHKTSNQPSPVSGGAEACQE